MKVISWDEEKLRLQIQQSIITLYYTEIESLRMEYNKGIKRGSPLMVRPRSPLAAGLSSAIIPGMGQFYSWEWSKGAIFLRAEALRIAVGGFPKTPGWHATSCS